MSVVVPAYNAVRTIGAALSGALDQTRPPDEVVVVDDASTDGTAELATAFAGVKVIRQPVNGGPAAARNAALRAATGDVIAWLDADDLWLPGYLETMLGRLEEAGPRAVVTGDAWMLTPAGLTGRRLLSMPHPAPPRQRLSLMRSSFVSALAVYPAGLHAEVGYLDPSLRGGEDRDLWLRAVLHGWTVVRQPTPLAVYRWTGPSASSDVGAMDHGEERLLAAAARETSWTLTDQERCYLRLRRRLGSPRRLRAEADDALRAGDHRRAGRLLAAAVQLSPGDHRLRARALLTRTDPGARLARRMLHRTDSRLGVNDAMRR